MTRAALLCATAVAACSESTAPPPPEPPGPTEVVSIAGTVVTADSRRIPDVVILGISDADTVAVPAGQDGRFAAALRRPIGDSIVVVISESVEPAPDYLPTLKSFGPEDETTGLSAMLIPATYTVPSGDFAGRTVPMSLQAAIAPENQTVQDGNGTFFFLNRWVRPDANAADPFSPGEAIEPGRSLWTNAWSEERLPLPLYFEHDGPNLQGRERSPISTADSIAIWEAIDDLESRLGADLFKPAVRDDIPLDSIQRPGAPFAVRLFAVSLEMIPELASPGVIAGFAGADPSCQVFGGDACDRFGPGELVAGEVTLSSLGGVPPDRARWLVQHELVHALGFGHACFRPSVMAACKGPYSGISLEGGDPNPLASPYDAAYIGWYRLIHDASRRIRPHFGIVEALDGERRSRHRRAPVPQVIRCQWGEVVPECVMPGGPPPSRVP